MAQLQYLLDTNICIYIRRERPQAVLDRFKVLPPGSTTISVITCGELIYRVQKSPDPVKAMMILDELTALIPVVPLAIDVATIYGRIRSDLAARGELIGNNDLWIAAHAKSLGLTLVTNNEREFKRVHGLVIENWAKS
ncbi:type II toxin-antitoxin system VapC family toxin [Microvirga sp. 3-52]|uniref:type II toxin-antitoxin system tRNA(fMet)-specific endonuclease VapC n=1 Tax=Microvirga sp. 3-52 TaxID=2792425 RepID=UPI001AC9CF4E|nr:type II toxin-antitoxin system VapC family toxin [Microvirga sp. 3-52]MBO1905754.1 type II toxin-antitoxin system VapC family toxin [Microvirga sp. 3-52]MBS7453147.1 type II toxin-antitoxin system VapC family toxin [Microvirga sp. 3-52]